MRSNGSGATPSGTKCRTSTPSALPNAVRRLANALAAVMLFQPLPVELKVVER